MKSFFCEKKNIDGIKKYIDKYECISFDVFDTLVKRNVKTPTDLYKLIGKEIDKKYGVNGFEKIRYSTELNLYKRDVNITIDDIYIEIQHELPELNCEEIKEIEIQYEISYCQSNQIIQNVYDYARSQGKKIIAVSDMYLPECIVRKILKKCGYKISSVYVSCDYKATKRSGNLFKIVMKEEKLNKKKILHIGDSLRADYIGAKKNGISAIKIDKAPITFNTKRFTNKIHDKFKYDIHESIINNNLFVCKSYYEKFGFSILGPALFSFCHWIEEQCIEQEIKTVFFFSRDGYIIKKVFDKLTNGNIKSKYLCVSRRSLRTPYNAKHFNIEEIVKLLPNTKYIKIDKLFEYLNLEIVKYREVSR